MESDMESSPIYFQPDHLSSREPYRRYKKRSSTSSISPLLGRSLSKISEARLLYDGNSIQRRPNTSLLLDEIKQESENYDTDLFESTSTKTLNVSEGRLVIDNYAFSELNTGVRSVQRVSSQSLKSSKNEDEVFVDGGESTFTLFASLLDSALQGCISFPDLLLQFKSTCRNVYESIRYGTSGRHRVVEDKFMQQKARYLRDEAASWSLLWYLFGKGNEELPESLALSPTTSHQEACQFVMADHTAQLCVRVILWLEELSSESLNLEKKVKGAYVGSYPSSFGVWHHTQRYLMKNKADQSIVQHMDFDAPTREAAQLLPDDKKQDELLLEDIWILLRAGRLEEASELCRSAGQPWRAATLCPFGGVNLFPSIEAVQKNKKSRTLQAIELESGIGHQWRLWKWASYQASEKIAEQIGGKYEMAIYASQCSNLKRLLPVCTDWESACWAMAKSWLGVQIDVALTDFQQSKLEDSQYNEDMSVNPLQRSNNALTSLGPETWPSHVLVQQPRDLPSLLQKLHSSDIVNEAVCRACKEQHRQVQMNLMRGDIAHLLDLLWSWISPPEEDQNDMMPHGDPQMIRFGAHVVLVLRYLLGDEIKDAFTEKLTTVGDSILQMYAMFLFSKQHEELVGIYASQLARPFCIDLFVNMMELRLNSSVHVKYKLFLAVVQYLPFSSDDNSKASFEDIIERVLSRSREVKVSKSNDEVSDVAEQHRLQSLQKAMVVQWLCFTPPTTITDFKFVKEKLLVRALMHSNTLFREFALISMWRVPNMPEGAHMLLSFLAEPLKQPEANLPSVDDDDDVPENLHEFEDWHEYYSCDASYRNWLKIELENSAVPPTELSSEEKEVAIAAARETLHSSLSLLLREGSSWLSATETSIYESAENVFLELHATAILCRPSGESLCPDATLCTALTSALYSSVTEDDVLKRQLMVHVSISSRDKHTLEIALRCLPEDGDGLGLHEANDGGFLAKVMAAGFKGELNRFQLGVTVEISRIDAWYADEQGMLLNPAIYIVKGLCRRCCIPELILRCMQVSVSLAEIGESSDHRNELIELVSSTQSGTMQLFSQNQLQEFLLFERDCNLSMMEFQEDSSMVDA